MLLVTTDPVFAEHDAGLGHPESSSRLTAVAMGVADADLGARVLEGEPRDATLDELERVHTPALLTALEATRGSANGTQLDPDTRAGPGSWDAARRAAGAGLHAVETLAAGRADAAFLAVRPPGHHATPTRAMGFCLLNNVAVTAAALAARGARVAIVDIDAHHGNGTQEIFWARPDVLYVSLHQSPLYPGTGALGDVGAGPGSWATCNLPVPPGATGDVYARAFDAVVEPVVAGFAPEWMLVSLGFDAHRADPLAGLGLSAADYGALALRLRALAPPGRLVAFLEGGYDLEALRAAAAASVRGLVGEDPAAVEAPTAGGPGAGVVDAARELWRGHL